MAVDWLILLFLGLMLHQKCWRLLTIVRVETGSSSPLVDHQYRRYRRQCWVFFSVRLISAHLTLYPALWVPLVSSWVLRLEGLGFLWSSSLLAWIKFHFHSIQQVLGPGHQPNSTKPCNKNQIISWCKNKDAFCFWQHGIWSSDVLPSERLPRKGPLRKVVQEILSSLEPFCWRFLLGGFLSDDFLVVFPASQPPPNKKTFWISQTLGNPRLFQKSSSLVGRRLRLQSPLALWGP